MEKYYIARNYRSRFDAAGKAKMDCETILQNNGWKNIGFKQTWISNAIIGTIVSAVGITLAIIRLKPKSQLCLQYPLNKFYNYILWAAKLKQCKVVTIVHDVYTLKGKLSKKKKELITLSKSDSLIVHNPCMRKWFLEQKLTSNFINLDIFDYLHTKQFEKEKQATNFEDYRIVFAGNLGGNQSFIYQLDQLKTLNYHFDLYGIGFNPSLITNPNESKLNYKGFYPSDQVIDYIDGDFGLVWYGTSIETCEGKIGHYLKYNNPHKVSLYIQCDMPLIIWEGAAMATFVKDNNIGICIKSLHDIPEILKSLSPEDYLAMKQNIQQIKNQISSGFYLNKALKNAV